jgi:nucleotide-binding universal stress UspA family protein
MGNERVVDGPVVVGVDGSEASEQALVWASEYAHRAGTKLVVVLARSHHVSIPSVAPVPVWPWPVVNVPDAKDAAQANSALQEVVEATIADDVKTETQTVVVEGPAIQGILDVAKKVDASLVVTGRRGLGGFKRLMLGSVSDEVARYAPCSVVITNKRQEWQPTKTIVVGVDGSADGDAALVWAANDARRTGSALHVVHAWDFPDMPAGSLGGTIPWLNDNGAELTAHAEEMLQEAIVRCSIDVDDLTVTQDAMCGYPSEVLTKVARDVRAELLVVGTRGLGGFAQMMLGSVAHQCLHHAGCPVAVIRP